MQKIDFLKSIQEAKAKKDYDAMLVNAKTAMQAYPSDDDFQELLHDAQGYYVNQKLESDLLEKLEEKEDWQGLQAVYLKLLSVFPDSKKLHKLLEKVRTKNGGAYPDEVQTGLGRTGTTFWASERIFEGMEPPEGISIAKGVGETIVLQRYLYEKM